MQFGVFFPMQLARPWDARSEYRLFQESLEQVEAADRLGFQYCWAQEHHFLEEYSHSCAPEVFLAAASQRTTSIRLGHGVALMPSTYNHPARVAERLATLDLISGGRVEWGTGESSSRMELEGFNTNLVEKRSMWAEAVRQAALMMSMEPYPGFDGDYFTMPCRNVVPKPLQKPHPPLWVACTSRDTLKLAARLGLGALTFSFMDAREAKFWVEEYYEIFSKEAAPLGRSVNPNVAMLGGLMCHRNRQEARRLGLEGQAFFKWALAHYYRFGIHTPGRTNLWEAFCAAEREPMAGILGVGDPDEVRGHFEELEDAGVDQIILLHQAAGYRHEDIMASLQLFGNVVLPDFIVRDRVRQVEKQARLTTSIAEALDRLEPEPGVGESLAIKAYPRLWEDGGVDVNRTMPKRTVEGAAIWKMSIAGIGASGT